MRFSQKTSISLLILFFAFLTSHGFWYPSVSSFFIKKFTIQKTNLHQVFSNQSFISNGKTSLPSEITLPYRGKNQTFQVQYTISGPLQEKIEALFQKHKPDYGAFVAIRPTDGKILSLVTYNPHDPKIQDHLALRATFPSASIFKVVTAAAAISEKKLHPDSVISYNGLPHTLYKKNVFSDQMNRWTNHVTLKKAFARSVNTVFGKLGVFILGPSELRDYADRFGFDGKIVTDLPFQLGRSEITEDPWEVAETASGFTQTNTLSPIHGALIAATVANDGKMMEPFIVDQLMNSKGEVAYQAQPKLSAEAFDADTASSMRELMQETVRSGTSRGSFRGFRQKTHALIEVGGKTGTLTGKTPFGKYDWFIGYASSGGEKIAFASLTISKKFWKVKSATLARQAIETYFEDTLHTSRLAERNKKNKK